MYSDFKIQHTTSPPYNPSSNPVECFQRTITAMLRTRGPGVQDNWDLWINDSIFAYNTIVSTSTGVTPHYAMFRRGAMIPVDWVFPTPSVEKRTMYQWTGDRLEKRQCAYKSMRDVQGIRVRSNGQMYKLLTQNKRVGCLVWYFHLRIIPGTSHKLRLLWAGPYQVFIKVDSSSLGRDQTSILSRRREIGEPGRVEAIPWGRPDSPGS